MCRDIQVQGYTCIEMYMVEIAESCKEGPAGIRRGERSGTYESGGIGVCHRRTLLNMDVNLLVSYLNYSQGKGHKEPAKRHTTTDTVLFTSSINFWMQRENCSFCYHNWAAKHRSTTLSIYSCTNYPLNSLHFYMRARDEGCQCPRFLTSNGFTRPGQHPSSEK